MKIKRYELLDLKNNSPRFKFLNDSMFEVEGCMANKIVVKGIPHERGYGLKEILDGQYAVEYEDNSRDILDADIFMEKMKSDYGEGWNSFRSKLWNNFKTFFKTPIMK